MAYYMYHTLFFRDKWKISRVFMFSGLHSEPFLAVQNFWKRQRIIYLQNTYTMLVLTVWSPTRQDTKVNQISLQQWLEVKLALDTAEHWKWPVLHLCTDSGTMANSVEVATAMEAGQLTVQWYTPLGCWIMARYCCSGRECDCKSTSQDAHVPKSRGTEQHWKNEQETKLLELKWLRWRWTGNTRVGHFYSLMGWWPIRTFRKGCNK